MLTALATPEDDLQALFDSLPEKTVVMLAEGTYRQKVMIRTPGLTVLGAGADKTRLVYGDYAKKRDHLGAEYNTFRTWTLAVCADGVTLGNLTVENDALAPEKLGQEVALSVVADDFRMENCVLRSTQDTLFLGPLPSDLIGRYEGFLEDPLRRYGRFRQYFRNCRIEGTVDFIFGCGEARFESCEIRSLRDQRRIGFVAAPSHDIRQTEGFHFLDCAITAEAGVPEGSVFLARPWRDHGMTVFTDCICGSHIAPEGFDKWQGTARDRTARFYETPEVPGRVSWINRSKQ
jgi:pectinesterase